MPLTSEQGYKIREELSLKRKMCAMLMVLSRLMGHAKIDGQNADKRVSIKNASGSSTQVHLTTSIL